MTDNNKEKSPLADIEYGRDNTNTREYTSTRGYKILIKPWPLYLRETIIEKMAADGFVRPDPPTYEVELVGGEIEKHIHTPTTIVGDREAEKEYAAFVEARTEWMSEYGKRVYDWSIIKCIELVDETEQMWQDWEEEQQAMGLEVPTKRLDRKAAFIKTTVVGSQQDIVEITSTPFALSLSESEVQQKTESMFRAFLERWNKAQSDQAVESGEELDDRGSVGSDAVEAVADFEVVEQAAK